jgi:hypothetical protein
MRSWSWYLLGACSSASLLFLLYKLTHPRKTYASIPPAHSSIIYRVRSSGGTGCGTFDAPSMDASVPPSTESQAGTPEPAIPVEPRDWFSSCPAGTKETTGCPLSTPTIPSPRSVRWCTFYDIPSSEHGVTGQDTEGRVD